MLKFRRNHIQNAIKAVNQHMEKEKSKKNHDSDVDDESDGDGIFKIYHNSLFR